VPGYLDRFVVKKAKGRMKDIGGEMVPIILCGSLLWMMIVVEAGWSFAPSLSWIRGISDNLLCGDWYHCHGTCSTKT
jgi:hypothetical protein